MTRGYGMHATNGILKQDAGLSKLSQQAEEQSKNEGVPREGGGACDGKKRGGFGWRQKADYLPMAVQSLPLVNKPPSTSSMGPARPVTAVHFPTVVSGRGVVQFRPLVHGAPAASKQL